ncbi:hypothetical protein RHMOL_Rhmol13G0271500 [Rhododendron molle]|uniref:Uncharacterized protein n=1 Tax=Rhododendron molle TaxID=49168 RepID=A0ACC0LBN0_RHOML|nr:hypothetical protein RHMOL_Rhmol13G0271500 [Rhododendron molle]
MRLTQAGHAAIPPEKESGIAPEKESGVIDSGGFRSGARMMILMIENWLIEIIKWIFVQSPGNWRAAVQAVNDDMNPPKLQRGQAAVSSDRRRAWSGGVWGRCTDGAWGQITLGLIGSRTS